MLPSISLTYRMFKLKRHRGYVGEALNLDVVVQVEGMREVSSRSEKTLEGQYGMEWGGI